MDCTARQAVLGPAWTKRIWRPRCTGSAQRMRARPPLPLAPEIEQRELVAQVHGALHRIEEARRAADRTRSSLSALDTSILAKAFRGELVPQDPNDEPASVMLERIRAAR